jgi:ankyrin repeat protein
MALVHITNVIKESRRSLDYLAKSMASLLEGDAKHDYYMGCLPNVLLEYENFDRVLTDEIRGTRCTSEVLNDTLVMPTLSSLCSRNPDPIRLNFVQKSVIHAQELGNYGQAFIMLVQLGLENRGGLSSNNRLALSRNRLRLLHWIKAVLQRDEIKPFVPKSIGDASSLLLSSGNYPSWVVEEHQAGNDCLHRSTFHLALDLHLPAPWPPTDIDHQDVLGRTVLYIACSIGDEGLVQRLLQCNAKIHKCTVTGLNPVHVAAIKGYTSISTSLLAKELQNGFLHSTLIAGDCIGRNPLHYACMGGHIEMVQSFCEHSSILVLGRDKFGYSAMTLAVQANQLEIVRWLLPYNLSSDLPDMMGRTPFWYAIHFKHLEIMRALGEVANIEHQDYAGRTPLAEAARAGFKEGVRYLLGFNSAAGDEYWRPIEIKCNPNSKDHQGKSPLVLAAEGGHTKCFQLLIRHKPLQYQREDLVQAANAAESAGHGNLVSLIDINELLSSSFSRRI